MFGSGTAKKTTTKRLLPDETPTFRDGTVCRVDSLLPYLEYDPKNVGKRVCRHKKNDKTKIIYQGCEKPQTRVSILKIISKIRAELKPLSINEIALRLLIGEK